MMESLSAVLNLWLFKHKSTRHLELKKQVGIVQFQDGDSVFYFLMPYIFYTFFFGGLVGSYKGRGIYRHKSKFYV